MTAAMSTPPPTLADDAPDRDARDSLARLTARAAGGDQAAFDAIHQRLTPGLRRLFLQRSGARDDVADDLLQGTWLAVWKALREGKYDANKSAFTTFLYAVGFKMWLQHLRRVGRSQEASIESEAVDAFGAMSGPAPESASNLADMLSVLRACLRGEGDGALDEQERAIVTAAASGVPDRELAKRLGVAPSTLNVRKQAALGKVRRYLAIRGFREIDSPERPARAGE